MATVTFDKISCVYPGSERASVDQFDLDIADGEFLVLVGPSGCGKSTTLRMLAGLEEVHSGSILIDGHVVNDETPKNRDIAMVFQNYALYPHMTVAENMGFALKIAGMSKADREVKVREIAKMLDLEPLLGRKPKALSGGQRQRVAMGRAIIREPRVFLMDEPLSNLDAKLRVQTRSQIAAMQRRLGITTVYVTHDQTEALTMGDRIAVLKDGVLQQVGTPSELYETPRNDFVAGFIGSPAMNLIEVNVGDHGAAFGTQMIPIDRTLAAGCAEGRVKLGVRPEDLRIVQAGEPGMEVTIDIVEELGADGYVYGHNADNEYPNIVVRVDGRAHLQPRTSVTLSADADCVHFFDVETGLRLE